MNAGERHLGVIYAHRVSKVSMDQFWVLITSSSLLSISWKLILVSLAPHSSGLFPFYIYTSIESNLCLGGYIPLPNKCYQPYKYKSSGVFCNWWRSRMNWPAEYFPPCLQLIQGNQHKWNASWKADKTGTNLTNGLW